MMHIGWISIGNDNYGSTRIGVTNIHKGLLKQGHKSTLLNYNKNFNIDIEADIEKLKIKILKEKINIIIFHKVFSPRTLNLVNFCKEKNIKTIFANGDWSENPMYSLVDHVISGSNYIKDILYNNYGVNNSHYIDDALETSNYPVKQTNFSATTLNLGWFGNFSKLRYTLDFINSLSLINFKLHTISNAPCVYTNLKADYTMGAGTGKIWDTDFLIKFLLKNIDIVIIPINLNEGSILQHYAKTANRITFAMSLGIPVIATPLPTYEIIINNGINGFLAKTSKEWKEYLEYLKDSTNRDILGKKSVLEIRKRYHIDSIVEDWVNIFKL